MSVINTVLRELDHRGAAGIPAVVAQASGVRAVGGPARNAGQPARAVIGAAAVAAMVVAYLWTQGSPTGTPDEPSASATAIVPAQSTRDVVADDRPAAALSVVAERPESVSPPAAAAIAPAPDAIWGEPVESHRGEARAVAASATPVPERSGGGAARRPPSSPPSPAALARETKPAPAVVSASPRIERQERPQSAKDRSDAVFRNALESSRNGHLHEAEAGLRKALEILPANVAARQALLGLLLDGRRIPEAEALMREGLLHNPDHASFAMIAARLQVGRGDVPGALATLEAHASAARNNGDYLAFMGALLQRMARHAEAVDRYSEALALGNARSAWHLGRAISLRELGRRPEARADFEGSLASGELSPELQNYVRNQIARLGSAG